MTPDQDATWEYRSREAALGNVLTLGQGSRVTELAFSETASKAHDVFVRMHATERTEAEDWLYKSACAFLRGCFLVYPILVVEPDNSAPHVDIPDGGLDFGPGTTYEIPRTEQPK